VYDVDRKSARLSAPRLFQQFSESEGMPDGLCVDSSGAVYCACYGGSAVIRMSAGGERLEAFALPVRNVTSCCLGGPALDTLYVTTAEDGGRHPLDGALFARRVAVAGLPEPLYTIRAADEALP
jgi:sugar lactone lactonase YvrE